ncbi:MAG: glycogen/starch synthase [Verrucomicrobiota bacterium]|nr:glycogen/starch synthase [Verrucomicrobiota bacterium]
MSKRLVEDYTTIIKTRSFDDAGIIYDTSIKRMESHLPSPSSEKKLRVAMVGVEYADLLKQGGLAEAITGLSESLCDLGNEVQLVFPKYSSLPSSISDALTDPIVHKTNDGEEYKVYSYTIGKVRCQFIEHSAFEVEKGNIYQLDAKATSLLFSTFTALSTELLYEQKEDFDVIHLHDWHVAGIELKMKADHEQEWKEGRVPAIVFTFHNHQRGSQGRTYEGFYNYDPVINGYKTSGIIKTNDNLFVRALEEADAVTTVSQTFAEETQLPEKGEAVSFAIRQAARVGKLAGVLNGANLSRWNPKTDKNLVNWKEISTGTPLDLSFDENDFDLIRKKDLIRSELHAWITKYKPGIKIDFSKPIITYIGRYDTYQKGLHRLSPAIKAILRNEGQFICMGTGEDPEAKKILDQIEKEHKNGVFVIRDYRMENGKLYYQDGDQDRPGISSLVRAASDFIFIPSNFEPCGLVQFEGWQYGALAIGAATGGLADSINSENGFLFKGSDDLAAVIAKALTARKKQTLEERSAQIRHVMTTVKGSSWLESAKKYQTVYNYAISHKSKRGEKRELSLVETCRHRKIVSLATQKTAEEEYLEAYYTSSESDSLYLHRLYQKVDRCRRYCLPSPYGTRVDYKKHERLGSFPDGRFAVSAPEATKVELILTDDDGKERTIPMKKNSGVWHTSVPNISIGQKYQYRINGKTSKVDPYGKEHTYSLDSSGTRTHYSRVSNSQFQWSDTEWLSTRKRSTGSPKPLSVYEVHPHSMQKDIGYRELAEILHKHCEKTHYTHVELMGILEHPDVRSWGYQVTGYFSPTSRLGSMDDFKYLVNYLHERNIGVILDFVPAHFAKDNHGLAQFDGSNKYESDGVYYKASLQHWAFGFGAKHFNLQNKEVRDFLTSSAMYWIQEMHIDGLRIDCVRSLLNTWDSESSELFMRDLNAAVHIHGEGAITIAEEFSGNTKMTLHPNADGFGFDYKWHIAFLRKLFDYFTISPDQRSGAYASIKTMVNSDNFHKQMLFISHDQADDLFKINQKLTTDKEQKAQMRAILSFMMCLPGKKLNFMSLGSNTPIEWKNYPEDERFINEHQQDETLLAMIGALNQLYTQESAFYEFDDNGTNLEDKVVTEKDGADLEDKATEERGSPSFYNRVAALWMGTPPVQEKKGKQRIEKYWVEDPGKIYHGYWRKSSKGDQFLCLHNFTDKKTSYIPSGEEEFTEVFNSDHVNYGGTASSTQTQKKGFEIAPLSTIILKKKESI